MVRRNPAGQTRFARMSIAAIKEDLRFCHARRWPGRPLQVHTMLLLAVLSSGIRSLIVYRISNWWVIRAKRHQWRRVVNLFGGAAIGLLVWIIKVSCKNDILGRSHLEAGVVISDAGFVTLGANRVGSGTVIGARTTIGMRLGDKGLPSIGRDVWIGSDCVVYGDISIGDGATVLPSTVITKSIPSGSVWQGNPARLVLRSFNNHELRHRVQRTSKN